MKSYKSQTQWKVAQPFLPIENRLNLENEPEELIYQWENFNIHIDFYRSSNAKARIILFHGVGGNGRLLSFIAAPLFARGYEVVCPDLPLYGNTEYEGDILYDDWVKCGVEVVKHMSSIAPKPTFVFGLSAGGMLAYQVATECDNIKGIIATCLLDQRNPYITEMTASNKYVGKMGKKIMDKTHSTFGKIRVPMKLLANMKKITNNERLAKLLLKDKKSAGVRVPLSFVYSMLHPQLSIEPEEFTKTPLLLVHPECDRWTDIHLSRLFYDRLACDKKLVILEEAGHFPILI